MSAAFLRRLSLTNFRSYHAAQVTLAAAGPVVLTGANGAGKTNLIEAISLLAPGRGLRRATFEELAFLEGDGSWAVSAEIEGMLGLATLGTASSRPPARTPPPPGNAASIAKRCRPPRPLPTICVWSGSPRHGPAVQRPGLRAAALSRSPGAGSGRQPFEPRLSARALVALT